MASFKLDENFIKQIEKKCQDKAKALATEAREKLYDQYMILLDWYYADYQPKLYKGEPYYHRTFNLYNSAHKYYMNSHNSIFYGGVEISDRGMKDYPGIRGDTISAGNLLNTYIYNEGGTWHGGDWHGGYGVGEACNIYQEIHKYRDELYDDLKSRCTIKI